MKKRFRRLFKISVVILLAGFLFALWFHLRTRVEEPETGSILVGSVKLESRGGNFFRTEGGWLQQNEHGLWEMYAEGQPYERGLIAGLLTRHLIAAQEKAFIDRIREMIPSDFYLRFLKYFIYWFNRDLDKHIPLEYREEILGISRFASEDYNFIGSGYQRMLNYHSAHDIGHALQDLALVGCTSFGAWGSKTADGKLIIGRNFDFYVGDAFAENKIVSFTRPDKGHPFMMVTWGGMIGVVSGMNDKGLTVTINAASSAIPGSARTPISILAREILQYASTLREAVDIANRRQTFVSESILVGSASDNQAVIIEKSPFRSAVVFPAGDRIQCANHFQSHAFENDELNRKNMKDNASVYRFRRMEQYMDSLPVIGYLEAASILRDRRGLNGRDIGNGNEKAMNQLIAHHSVIFEPARRLVWVSTPPYQLGSYICYDLYKIFNNFADLRQRTGIAVTELEIPPDSFHESQGFSDFNLFRKELKRLSAMVKNDSAGNVVPGELDHFTSLNPAFWEGYSVAGDVLSARREYIAAGKMYRRALEKEIPRWKEKEEVIRKMADCKEQTKK